MKKTRKHLPDEGTNRRDFLKLTATSFGAVGVCAAAWPFISSMNPAADVMAVASIEVDVSKLEPGQSITNLWRGKPVFIKRRTAEEIKEAQAVELLSLPDPQTDQERFGKNPEWLVVIGICTHLGCVPTERKNVTASEEGWLCACHGSRYDVSGRIISGPAPRNLDIPPYELLNNNTIIKIG
ncbi:MAG: ubiquinol-cytochrome c reductase iron-sulfur subunit [Pseudomonadota bacterium]|jgi:ubiquinol-cytochrome c reductase iron-sulfur subunit|nr:ubiquinol-cytochrome c reductase iron-sulfur subunit [Alphaproteobacteria bacterium]